MVAGDARAARVHVHGDRPDRAIGVGLDLGSLSAISVEPLHAALDGQAHAPVVVPRPGPALVAVAAGDGIERILLGAGVVAVIRTDRPAARPGDQVTAAMAAAGSRETVVLAVGPDAADVVRRIVVAASPRITVVEARDAAAAIAAVLAAPSSSGIHAVEVAMRTAITRTCSASVVREPDVRGGCWIALDGDGNALSRDLDPGAVAASAVRALRDDPELVTLYLGIRADASLGERVSAAVARALPGAEVEVIDGGFPDAVLLVAAE
jgi:dihydroxyacetone kinase-like predicted kinase